jgi:hypothetical protein
MIKTDLIKSLSKACPIHKKRMVIERQRSTLESGVISINAPGTTLINVSQKIFGG